MDKHDKNMVELYLMAALNDLETYLKAPQDFEAEFFEDIREAVQESLRLLKR